MKFYIDGLGPKPHVSIGSQALVNAAIQILENRYPASEYYLLSSCPPVEEEYLSKTGCTCNILQRPGGYLKTYSRIRQITSQVDAIVCPWGDAYITSPPHMALRKILALRRPGVTMMLMTSSLGPFERGWKRFLSKTALKKFDILTVRDTITYDFFQSIGLKETLLVPDTAFVLAPALPLRVREIFAIENIPINHTDSYVGINISILLYNRMRCKGLDYPGLLAELIHRLRILTDRPIVLIPHQIYSKQMLEYYPQYRERLMESGGDDRKILPLLYQRLPDTAGVYAIQGEYSCYEYKGIISGCDIFIGGRMHSIIAALSSGVPSIIMQYSHKASGLMKMLSIPECCWDIQEHSNTLWEKLSALWKSRNIYRENLLQNIPDIQARTYASADILQSVLERRK